LLTAYMKRNIFFVIVDDEYFVVVSIEEAGFLLKLSGEILRENNVEIYDYHGRCRSPNIDKELDPKWYPLYFEFLVLKGEPKLFEKNDLLFKTSLDWFSSDFSTTKLFIFKVIASRVNPNLTKCKLFDGLH